MPYCQNCGAKVSEDARFCRACGAAQEIVGSGIGTVPPASVRTEVRREAGSVSRTPSSAKSSRSLSVRRIISLMLLLFNIGWVLLSTGLGGRAEMYRIISSIQQLEVVQSDDSLAELINVSARDQVVDFFVAIVRNDTQAMIDSADRLAKSAGSIIPGLSDGMDLLRTIFDLTGDQIFGEVRDMMIEETGPYWPALQVIVYYRECMISGGVLMAIAALAWYIAGGKLNDDECRRMRPAFIASVAWSAVVLWFVLFIPI